MTYENDRIVEREAEVRDDDRAWAARDHVTATDLRRHVNEPAHNQEESHG